MLPAKSRERKCSTCRHYQASPLWRKGWCRNPLLYDRNTNHLVEADSLACNRTFIDYWEPITEGNGPAGSSGKTQRPRIAPSIPMDPVDARGESVAGRAPDDLDFDLDDAPAPDEERSTPVAGSRALGSRMVFRPATTPPQRPPLALVDEDYDELLEGPRDPKETQQLETIDKTQPTPSLRGSARDRIQRGRQIGRPSINFPSLSGVPLYAAVGVLAVLLVIAAAFVIFNRPPASLGGPNDPAPTTLATVDPTPTGFGDPTATGAIVVQPAASPVVTDVIAVGGFVVVEGTGDGLLVRSSPSRQASRISKLSDGTKARVVDGPREAEGLTWWKLDSFDTGNPALTGWSAQDFLKPTTP